MSVLNLMRNKYLSVSLALSTYMGSLALLVLRLIVARVFLLSGLTKWDGFLQFNTGKYDLFLYEFFCPDPIRPGALQLCNPETLDYVEGSLTMSVVKLFAITAGVLEVVLPTLLITGLFTRFAALGLLAMTLFIQLAVFPGWDHWWNPAAWWAISLLVILVIGPGSWSVDRLIRIDGLVAPSSL